MQVKKLGYVLFVGVIAAVCILPAADHVLLPMVYHQ